MYRDFYIYEVAHNLLKMESVIVDDVVRHQTLTL